MIRMARFWSFAHRLYWAAYTYISDQWPTKWRSLIGQWAVNLGRQVLVMVSDRGDNKGQWATHSLIKWLTSTASILSWVVQIPLNFYMWKVKSVFLIVTKSGSDTTNQCSVTAKLNYVILQWANKGPANYFHLHVRAPPTAVPGCVDERIYGWPIFKWVAGTWLHDRVPGE